MKKLIIFTDLDGTLLDASTYSFEAAHDALHLIKERSIPLIFCSSKTWAEIEYYRLLLHNHDPLISENGGGIFIPVNHNDLIRHVHYGIMEFRYNYFIISFGTPYADLRKGIAELRELGFKIQGFGDMSAEEIAKLTGLSSKEAIMAKERDYDEPFLFHGSENTFQNLQMAAHKMGFNITRGRFHHLLGDNDKGKAVLFLLDLYKKQYGDIHSVALGDSPNDRPMLAQVDTPIIVRKSNGTYDSALNVPDIIQADGIGPDGWNKAVKKLILEINGK